jgi:hypothetical protein
VGFWPTLFTLFPVVGLDIHMYDQTRMVSLMPKCACVIPLYVFSNLDQYAFPQKRIFHNMSIISLPKVGLLCLEVLYHLKNSVEVHIKTIVCP